MPPSFFVSVHLVHVSQQFQQFFKNNFFLRPRPCTSTLQCTRLWMLAGIVSFFDIKAIISTTSTTISTWFKFAVALHSGIAAGGIRVSTSSSTKIRAFIICATSFQAVENISIINTTIKITNTNGTAASVISWFFFGFAFTAGVRSAFMIDVDSVADCHLVINAGSWLNV